MKRLFNNFVGNPKNDVLSGITVALASSSRSSSVCIRCRNRSACRALRCVHDGFNHLVVWRTSRHDFWSHWRNGCGYGAFDSTRQFSWRNFGKPHNQPRLVLAVHHPAFCWCDSNSGRFISIREICSPHPSSRNDGIS